MNRGLGKGINAFFPENETDNKEAIQQIKINELRPNPYQPRKSFDEEAINELKTSIEEHGIIQPLIVRKSIKGYDIVAGERRYRAGIAAKLNTVPAVIKVLTDKQMMEIALIENLQREDLNPIEEALAYRKLMDELGITQEELAKKLGKSRPYITNHLRLLQLSQPIQELLAEGKLSMGHGRTLLGLKDKKKLPALVDRIIKEKMNVRDLELLIQKLNQNVPRETPKKPKAEIAPELKQKVTVLRERFGTSVSIKQMKNKEKGKIEIDYYSQDDLNRLIDLLEGQKKG
ncbi:ParB family chromosome partitioning protein [Scopulibacillus darangshiensis]|uniref:ParB family chromosome partitioning protein n=1 Tax=Scopulibacillus darangshiensis TaxID=442528 RepID=A0A4R2NFP3_9BACL|nr:ParB/RepB/Spo0J family partition protein [Scopulibacillus darangshiensis]TCP20018.1 ParB family chromosome partitioning protein [Scopulibacillus darangshiensis]